MNLKIQNLVISDSALISDLCTLVCIANAPLTPMLKILWDLKTIGSFHGFVQVNRSLQLCFRISCFLSVCHQSNTK